MSSEFYVQFKNRDVYIKNRLSIDNKIRGLYTFKRINGNDEYWLKNEPFHTVTIDEWEFDVRIFLRQDDIVLEISLHPENIEQDISDFVTFLRTIDETNVIDDDGEPAKLTLY